MGGLDYTLRGECLGVELVRCTCRVENISLKPGILLWKWAGRQEEKLRIQNQLQANLLEELAGNLCFN
jgi:hypothetical protein